MEEISAPPPSSSRTRELKALTSLRFFAAFSVVLLHSAPLIGKSTDLSAFNLRQAVSLFFILSGFIMVYAYPTLPRGKVRLYWLSRIARIWPAHLAVTIFVLLCVPVTVLVVPLVTPAYVTYHLTLTNAWTPVALNIYSLNTVAWSLSVEAFFYLLFPALLWVHQRIWWLNLAASVLLVLLIAFWGVPFLSAHIPGTDAASIMEWAPLRLFEFTLGMATGLLWHWVAPRLRISRAVGTVVEILAIILVIGAMYSTVPLITALGMHVQPGLGAVYWIDDVGVPCPPYAALIFVLALEGGWITHLLSTRPFVALGRSSYSLYIIHWPLVLFVLASSRTGRFARLPHILSYPAFLLTVIGAAFLLWGCVEQPARRLILRAGRRTQRSTAPHPVQP